MLIVVFQGSTGDQIRIMIIKNLLKQFLRIDIVEEILQCKFPTQLLRITICP